jgi:hypothetical protein
MPRFFDLGDNTASEPSSNTPSWVNHIALEMDSFEEVRAARVAGMGSALMIEPHWRATLATATAIASVSRSPIPAQANFASLFADFAHRPNLSSAGPQSD